MPLVPSRLLPLEGVANPEAGAQVRGTQVAGAGNPGAGAQVAGARVAEALGEVEVKVADRLALCRRRLCQSSKVGSFCCPIHPPDYLCVISNQHYLQDLRLSLHSCGCRFSTSRSGLAAIRMVDTYTYYLDVSPSSFVDCFAIPTVGYLTKGRYYSLHLVPLRLARVNRNFRSRTLPCATYASPAVDTSNLPRIQLSATSESVSLDSVARWANKESKEQGQWLCEIIQLIEPTVIVIWRALLVLSLSLAPLAQSPGSGPQQPKLTKLGQELICVGRSREGVAQMSSEGPGLPRRDFDFVWSGVRKRSRFSKPLGRTEEIEEVHGMALRLITSRLGRNDRGVCNWRNARRLGDRIRCVEG